MIYKKQEIFGSAVARLRNKDIKGFSKKLKDLYEISTCNCFFKNKSIKLFEELVALVQSIDYDNNSFDINLSKGFCYLQIKEYERAYIHLTKAIQIVSENDLAYSLRSTINEDINPNFIKDSKRAVELNPTARNHFVYANNLAYSTKISDKIESQNQFKEAINKFPNFPCAYFNQGYFLYHTYRYNKSINRYIHVPVMALFNQDKYRNAIDLFHNTIELNPNHWAYYYLAYCYDQIYRYDKALKYNTIGLKKDPNNSKYYYHRGCVFYKLKKYEDAIKSFKLYQSIFPNSSNVKNCLVMCDKAIQDKKNTVFLNSAINNYNRRNYVESVKYFDAFIKRSGGSLHGEELEMYLVSKVAISNDGIFVDKNHFFFKKLDSLIESYIHKEDYGIKPSKEETVAYRITQYGLKQELDFGKYKYRTLAYVLDNDPYYLIWCITRLYKFCVENEVLTDDRITKNKEYLLAVEYNLVKKLVIDKWKPNQSSIFSNPYYNDNLDLDQQNPNFWDSI